MPDNLYKKRYVMDILTVKQLDTDKVKDLVYGLKTSKRIRLYVPVYTPEALFCNEVE